MGEFPEILYRRYLDKNLSFIKLKNIFGRVLKQLESEDYDDWKGKEESSILTLSSAIGEFPEHFLLPKTLYAASCLKELLEQDKTVVAFVNSIGYPEIQRRMIDNIYYKKLNFSKFIEVKDHKSRETDEERVKKQALLDNLLDNFPWAADDILSSISTDTLTIPPNQRTSLMTTYSNAFIEYSNMKKAVLKYERNELEGLQKKLEEDEAKKRQRKLEKAREF